jgi:exo-beta-1,3-glucanase (GH17 family)
MTLHRAVYTTLKASHPDLPLVVSVTGIDLLEGYTDANHEDQMRALADLVDYTDILGLSVYPYMTAYMTNVLPEAMFDDLAALTDKPLAITETGYPAQSFGINAEEGLRLEFDSDTTKQERYIQLLLNEAQQHEFRFIINFVLRDYDALWRQIGANEDLTIAWRDTGLYDEDGGERPALAVWREWLEKPVLANG